MAARWQDNYQIYKRYVRNLSLMYQKRKDLRSFVELLLSLSVIAIFGIFALRPTLVTIADLNNQIGGKADTIERLDDKIEALIAAQESYDRNRAAIALVEQAIPTRATPEAYIRQIEGLAQRHSLFIVGLNTGGVVLFGASAEATEEIVVAEELEEPIPNQFPPDASSFNFEINVSGSYADINAFLRDFESMRRPMYSDVLAIRISEGDLPGEIVGAISGRLAYLPLPSLDVNIENVNTDTEL